MVGVSHRGEPDTPLDKTLRSNSLISTASTLFHVHTSLSWKDTNGNTIGRSSLSFPPPIIATDVATKLRLWRWTIRSINAPKTQFTITANFLNLTLRQEMKAGTRVPERLITFCKWFERSGRLSTQQNMFLRRLACRMVKPPLLLPILWMRRYRYRARLEKTLQVYVQVVKLEFAIIVER